MGDPAKRPSRYAPVAANENIGRGADVFDIAQAYGLNAPLTMALKYLIRFQREGNGEDAEKARYCLERAEELEGNREYNACGSCGHDMALHDTQRNRVACAGEDCSCERFTR